MVKKFSFQQYEKIDFLKATFIAQDIVRVQQCIALWLA